MRAVTLEVNEFSGVAGNLLPGCRVDVLHTLRDDASGEAMSRAIVQNVLVTAIGMHRTPGDESNDRSIRSVTLLVKPAQAEALELASINGHPRLVLRGADDNQPYNGAGVTLADLRGKSKNNSGGSLLTALATAFSSTSRPAGMVVETDVAPATRPSDVWNIRIIKGGSATDATFEIPAQPATANGPVANSPTDEVPH
jgi:Flp pilus assembly protein CpaB